VRRCSGANALERRLVTVCFVPANVREVGVVLIVSMMRVLLTTLSGPRQLHALVEGTCGAFLLAGRERIRLRAQTIMAYREQAPLVRLTTLEEPNKTRFALASTKLSCLTRGFVTPEQQVLDLGEDVVMHCRVRTVWWATIPGLHCRSPRCSCIAPSGSLSRR